MADFEIAAKKHYRWNCSVGGGTKTTKGRSFGMGCVLDDKHVLTARHVWAGISDKFSWPIVLRAEGLFACEIIFESESHDILVLRSTKIIDSSFQQEQDPKGSMEYPILSPTPIFLGSSVGFMSNLNLNVNTEGADLHTHFAAGFVSMLLQKTDEISSRFALSSTVIQSGFSGSAVFKPDGSIVAVVVEKLSFRADFQSVTAPIYTMPVISPIALLAKQIESAISK